MDGPFSRYIHMDVDGLLRNLARVQTDIAQAQSELAMVMVDKERAKVAAYGAGATSVRALEINADLAATVPNQEVIKIKGEIAALTEEKQFLLLMIERGATHA